MDDKRIQIIEGLRNLYSLNNEDSLSIYNRIIKDGDNLNIDIIFNDLIKLLEYKDDMQKRLLINLNKVINKYDEIIDNRK